MITRVLVTVMTYPTLSKNHFETVCTAGFREDGSWIRIYPVPHRLLFQYDKPKYGKWQWIEADLEKNPRDGRPESFHIKNIESLKILDKIDAGAPNWNLRDHWIKKNKIVFNDMTEVLKLTKENKISLAILKPTEFLSISSEEEDLTSYNQRLTALKKNMKQISFSCPYSMILKLHTLHLSLLRNFQSSLDMNLKQEMENFEK